MMEGKKHSHSAELVQRIGEHLIVSGDTYVGAIDKETLVFRRWLQHLGAYEKTGSADILIEGVSSAILEVAACLTVGFARVALGSIRSQIDLVLSWLYFKDHPVEWERLSVHGDGFMQKSELLKYLGDKYLASFGERMAILRQVRTRKIEDPFALLSAHLHKQSAGAVVSIGSCADAICAKSICDEVVVLQASTSEYLADVLLACFSHQWAALPEEVVSSARARLTKAQEKVIFN